MKPNLAIALVALLGMVLLGSACTKQHPTSHRESVRKALDQAGLTDVGVSEEGNNNTITLSGAVPSQDAKQKCENLAEANAGARVVVNVTSVEPGGRKPESYDIATLDNGIGRDYRAALESKGLSQEQIRFEAKDGVLTLRGSVQTPVQRREAQQLAQATPNVVHVVNEIYVQR